MRVLEAADGERINDKQKAKDSARNQRRDRHHQQQLEVGAGGDLSQKKSVEKTGILVKKSARNVHALKKMVNNQN